MIGTNKGSRGLGFEKILNKYDQEDVPTGAEPQNEPSVEPQGNPSGEPSGEPTGEPQGSPSGEPSGKPNTPTGEPTGEPSGKPTGEPQGEPTGNLTGEPSSLTPTAEPSQPQPPQVTEEMIFKTLSEKLGKEVKSYDDLTLPNAVELRDDIKALNEWAEKTGRPVSDYFKFTKDFGQMSDLDIAREYLQIEYPSLTPSEIELEMKQYVKSEDDLDDEAAMKQLSLKKYAAKGRQVLEGMKLELNSPSQAAISPEIKSKVETYDKLVQEYENQKVAQEQYVKGLQQALSTRNDLDLQLTEDLAIKFNLTPEEKANIPKYIETMPHWRNQDGSWNHDAVVTDAIKLRNFPNLIKLAFEQGLNAGKEQVIKGDVGNVTLEGSSARQPDGASNRPVYENFDVKEALGGRKLRFKK